MHCRCAFAAIFLAVVAAPLCSAQNPIQTENAKSGTSGWQLANPATSREIEGYASFTSVNIGSSIDFSVSTTDSTFNIDIFRTGWYGGIGARLLQSVTNLTGVHRSTPSPDSVTGMVECKWPSSYTLSVPTSWVSGIYLARLTGNQSGKQSYIIFVVRDDNRTSALLFESSVTTFQAYNFWPGGTKGKSLYEWAPGGRAWKVSFNRPYVLGDSYSSTSTGVSSGVGAGEFLTNLQPGPVQGYSIPAAGFEYNMVRWLEKNGYDVTYFTDIDLHENAALLKNHRAYLSVGHNEYWSMQMRQNIQNALSNGLNLGFFSANTMYYQVRFEASSTGTADRTMVCYKNDAPSNDPLYNSNPQLATVTWRQSPVNLPEAAMVGNEYVGDPVESDIVISNATHWLMNGTGLHNGDHLTGILGYEVDVMVPGTSPGNVQVLTSSPVGPLVDTDNPPGFSCDSQTCDSNAIWYSAGKAFVFGTGSMQWSWGLDDYNAPSLRSAFSSAAAQQITVNVLGAFVNPVTVTTTSLPAGMQGQAYGPVQLTANGGGPPYNWSATGLPSGLSLSSAGVLSGTPTTSGTSSVNLTVTDDASHVGTATLSLSIAPAAATYTISGQITASGAGLSGVTVSLSAGSTTTTNSNGNYSFAGLPSGTYTVTPSLSGYTFSPASQNVTVSTSSQTANFTASVSSTPARAVSIDFVGSGTAMAASESAGVVAKTNWNSATNNVSSAPLALKDETGAGNGATVTWSSDNNWALPITDAAGNVRMMRGYLDNGSQNPITVNVAGLPASSTGYDVYVYIDGDNETDNIVGKYTISGAGLTTTSINATDAANTNFSGSFIQASNSNGNYVKFSAVQATAFTLTATPVSGSGGVLRSPVNGIQIVPAPAAGTARAVSIDFVGSGTAMAASESAGVVAKTNWNSATNNVSSAPLALKDETGAGNGATVTWSSDNNWALPITDAAGNVRMMRGYLDNGSQNPITVNVAGLPASSTGYDVYVYIDGDNETDNIVGKYTISGAGLTTTSINATDAANTNFSGSFIQASNSNGNYVKFSAVQATAFTLTATPTSTSSGGLRAPVNGIQVIPH